MGLHVDKCITRMMLREETEPVWRGDTVRSKEPVRRGRHTEAKVKGVTHRGKGVSVEDEVQRGK